jgi:3-oxoacyl-(acyl-carrier-protein) synthase/acyl carrier protein
MEYAAYRNSLVAAGKRHGQTVAINWPAWRDGGMGANDKSAAEMYLKSSGQNFLEISEGMQLLEGILSSGKEQVLVIKGLPDRVHRFLGLEAFSEDILPEEVTIITEEVTVVAAGKGRRPEMQGLSVTACVTLDLREQIGGILKLSPQKINPEENLVDMGYDSISLTKLATSLSKHYELEITPALFFGYATLNRLCDYFMKEHTEPMTLFYRGEVINTQQRPTETKQQPPTETKQKTPSPSPVNRQGWPVHSPDTGAEPIAIIGISGRFPDARNVDEMWDILFDGKTAVEKIPADRFDWQSYGGDAVNNTEEINATWCGNIPGVKEFDPLFFEISPREAETMDPRQRLLLQESWKALEDAGYGATQLKAGKVGVFVGVEQGDYQLITGGDALITSNHDAILAARISYFLNLDGPVVAINTACSSGLVAAHQACQSLRSTECDTAIAAGVSLILTPMSHAGMSKAGMLSEEGKCFVFDKRANGIVPGEAVVAVVLKRLSRALEDGDPVYGVIRGSGINYDGKTNGITAPSGIAQANLLKEIYDRNKINPEDITYVVTHGTGTKLGDPVEVNALNDAFKKYTDQQSYCALTSAKTNFGHTLAASGLVSLVSLVQAMQHNTIPASLHFEEKNDYIQWASSPFYVNQQNRTWLPQAGKPLMGAVSAFGMSGTNAHMVVQTQGSTARKQPQNLPYYLLPLSAKTAACLEEKISDMVVFLESGKADQVTMHELSYTLQQGRQHFNHRCAIVVANQQEAIDTWKLLLQKGSAANIFKGAIGWETTKDDRLQEQIAALLAQSEQERHVPAAYLNSVYILSDLYCKGYDINWTGLYGANTPARVHLPTYPFSRDNYWVTADENKLTETNVIHPLLHQNTSDLSQLRFTTDFSAIETWLKYDSATVADQFFPGLAYLEMARAAATNGAIMAADNNRNGIQLSQVEWAWPLSMKALPMRLHTALFEEPDGIMGFEVYQTNEKDPEEPVVFCQGYASSFKSVVAPVIPLREIKEEWERKSADKLLIDLSQRGISGTARHPFIVDPVLIHKVLQSAAISIKGIDNKIGDLLPVSLQSLEIFEANKKPMWALLQFKEQHTTLHLNISLCDEEGGVSLRMNGLVARLQ